MDLEPHGGNTVGVGFVVQTGAPDAERPWLVAVNGRACSVTPSTDHL